MSFVWFQHVLNLYEAEKITKKHWRFISRNKNVTLEMVKMYPDLPWRYDHMLANPNVTLEDVQNLDLYPWWNPDTNEHLGPWFYNFFMHNETLHCRFGSYRLETNENLNLNARIFSIDPIFTHCLLCNYGSVDLIETKSKSLPNLNFKLLSKNPNITWEFITKHKHADWNRYSLLRNPNITMDLLPEAFKLFTIQSVMFCINHNPNLTWAFIEANLHLPWNFDAVLSQNSIVTWEIFQTHRHLWSTVGPLTIPSDVSWEEMKHSRDYMAHLKKYKDGVLFRRFVDYYNLSWEEIQEYEAIHGRNFFTSHFNMSGNQNITWEIVEANPKRKWNMNELLMLPMNCYSESFHVLK